jgi:hypothetical protein
MIWQRELFLDKSVDFFVLVDEPLFAVIVDILLIEKRGSLFQQSQDVTLVEAKLYIDYFQSLLLLLGELKILGLAENIVEYVVFRILLRNFPIQLLHPLGGEFLDVCLHLAKQMLLELQCRRL